MSRPYRNISNSNRKNSYNSSYYACSFYFISKNYDQNITIISTVSV